VDRCRFATADHGDDNNPIPGSFRRAIVKASEEFNYPRRV
jgi:hypothetical protein